MNRGDATKAHRVDFASNFEVHFSPTEHWLALLIPMSCLLVPHSNFIFSLFNVAPALTSAYLLHRKGLLKLGCIFVGKLHIANKGRPFQFFCQNFFA